MNKLELQKKANQLRKHIVTSLHAAKCGHPGVLYCQRDMWHRHYMVHLP